MPNFSVGDIVDIAIKGARVVHETESGCVVIAGEDGTHHLMPSQAAVTRVAPAMQVGDLWRDSQGDMWFAISADDGAFVELRCSSGGNPVSPDYAATTYGPLTLVHREVAS